MCKNKNIIYMLITKYKIITLVKIALSILVVIWFVGWRSISYDNNDINIGKKVIFTAPMIIVTDIPDSMAGEIVADKYGAMIWKKSYWEKIKSNFSKLNTRNVTCDEIFTVTNVIYKKIHGVLLKAFVGSGSKLYVLTSSNKNRMVISDHYYSEYILSVANKSHIPIIDNCKSYKRFK